MILQMEFCPTFMHGKTPTSQWNEDQKSHLSYSSSRNWLLRGAGRQLIFFFFLTMLVEWSYLAIGLKVKTKIKLKRKTISHTYEILTNNPDPLLIPAIVLLGAILPESKSTGRGNFLWSFELQALVQLFK